MNSRYIQLKDSERKKLIEVWHNDKSSRVRKRAHAVLLSSTGNNVTQLSKIFFVKSDTVSSWLNRWESSGIEGLYDAEGRGRHTIFSESEKKNLSSSKI